MAGNHHEPDWPYWDSACRTGIPTALSLHPKGGLPHYCHKYLFDFLPMLVRQCMVLEWWVKSDWLRQLYGCWIVPSEVVSVQKLLLSACAMDASTNSGMAVPVNQGQAKFASVTCRALPFPDSIQAVAERIFWFITLYSFITAKPGAVGSNGTNLVTSTSLTTTTGTGTSFSKGIGGPGTGTRCKCA